MIGVDEVDMVRKPTNSEDQNDYDKHLYNLKKIEKFSNGNIYIYIYISISIYLYIYISMSMIYMSNSVPAESGALLFPCRSV